MYFDITRIFHLLLLAFCLIFPISICAEIAQCNGPAPNGQPFTLLREMCHVAYSPSSKLRCECMEARIECPPTRLQFYQNPAVRAQAEICSSRCLCTGKEIESGEIKSQVRPSPYRRRRRFRMPGSLPIIQEYPQACSIGCTSHQICQSLESRLGSCGQALCAVDRVRDASEGRCRAVGSLPNGKRDEQAWTCPCNSTYGSTACCTEPGGVVYEPAEAQLWPVPEDGIKEY